MGLSSFTARDGLRRLACRLSGVRLLGDVHERAADLGAALPCGPKRRTRIERVAQVGLTFVHVPKAAGTSVAHALYGHPVGHMSIRQIRSIQGGYLAALPSFAILRHPVDRFLSACRYAREGGGGDDQVAPEFREAYRRFTSLDDVLDHIERARTPYRVDHIFRPQHWYLVDRDGRIAVDRLVRFDDLDRLPTLVPGFPRVALPVLNRSNPQRLGLSPRQRARIEGLYARDFALWFELTEMNMTAATGRMAKGSISPLPFRQPVAI